MSELDFKREVMTAKPSALYMLAQSLLIIGGAGACFGIVWVLV